tara:strand:+ start:1163 stop:1762 length:600 start_codon:yes stop_codon:yes gene_type:complete
MISIETPASFTWNDLNSQWVKNYLLPKTALLLTLTNEVSLDVNNLNEAQFMQLCQLLETTAEGRELRNKMFKAWRSKKSRDSDNGKKLYTFNLSIKAGEQLKKVAKNAPLNQTLESLIFAGKNSVSEPTKLQQKIENLKRENQQLLQQLSETNTNSKIANDEDEIESMISNNLHVTELAKLQKSQLIKQILLLKRKLNQ